MSVSIIVAILFAAFLHALWNFMVRNSKDKALGMAGVIYGHAILGVASILYLGLPPMESLPYIIIGTIFHVAYQIFLINAYRFGELTQVYPIARGSAPLIIAIASSAFFGEHLSTAHIVGVGIICCSILFYGAVQYYKERTPPINLILALLTGASIAGYSIVDGFGTRVVGSGLIFFGTLSILNGFIFSFYLMVFHKGVVSKVFTSLEGLQKLTIGGIASYLAYAIALWAILTTPIAVVSSVRQTSILFVFILGTIFLKEKITLEKCLMTITLLVGIVILELTV